MDQNSRFLFELRQVVLDNLSNAQFSVGHLSKAIGLSRSQLHRRLKKLRGQSISQYIRQIRLEEALKLLEKDEATISEIAYQVGFNSPSYFHKCFHDHYGCPPSEAKQLVQSRSGMDESSQSPINEPPSSALQPTDKLQRPKSKEVTLKAILLLVLIMIVLGAFGFYYLNKSNTETPVEKSIAVLPFINLSEEEANRHFSDGLVEDLLNRLATIKEFKVISRTSSDTYRERGIKKITEIASELGVSYIVEGSVQKHDDKARITIQLIDAINDKHIWVQTFDRDIADVFAVQSEIAVDVASEMSDVLTDKQLVDIQKNYTENPRAFELYQLGRYYWGKRLMKDYRTAIEYFEQAIAQDSSYSLAYAGLADTYYLMTWESSDYSEMKAYRDKAEAFALRALKLDPLLVEAHTVLATIYFFVDWDWAKADNTFARAFNLNHNYSTLHHRYSEFLSYIDRDLEARQHIDRALEMDPLSYIVREVSSKLYLFRGDFKKALEEARICEDLNNEKIKPVLFQFWANYMLQQDAAALSNIKKLYSILMSRSQELELVSVYNISGLDGMMRWVIENIGDIQWQTPLWKAQCHAYLGENDRAMDWLEMAFEKGDLMGDVPYRYYAANQLETHPRFIQLMEKMNLPWNPVASK